MMKISAFSLFFLLLTLLSVAVVAQEPVVNGLRNHRGLNGRLKRRLSGKGDDDDVGKGGKGKGDDDDAGKGGKGKGDDDDVGKGGKGKGDDDDAGKGGKGKGDDDDVGKGGKGVSRRHLQNIFA